MEGSLSEINKLIETNVSKQERVKAESIRVGQEMEDTFAIYVTSLTDRLMALKKKLAEESQVQIDLLLEERGKLQKLKASVESGLQQQKGWMKGQEMERKERESNVEKITSTVLDDFEQQSKPVEIQGMSVTSTTYCCICSKITIFLKVLRLVMMIMVFLRFAFHLYLYCQMSSIVVNCVPFLC